MKSIYLCLFLMLSWAQVNAQSKAQQTIPKSKMAPNSIVGVWDLTYFEGKDLKQLFQEKIPTIAIDPRKTLLSGHNACNSFRVPIKIKDFKIEFLKAITKDNHICNPEVEAHFMEQLAQVQGYTMQTPNKLELLVDQKVVFRFQRHYKQK